jgi:hypothetical protein
MTIRISRRRFLTTGTVTGAGNVGGGLIVTLRDRADVAL